MQRMEIHRLPTAGPDDVSGLARLIDDGAVSARDVIAVLGKTEGNGCVNDWSRGFSTAAYAALLATRLGTTPDAVTSRVQFIMSGGTEGIITPHVTVFVRRDVDATPRPGRGLVAGVASTRVFKPEELGTMVQIREVETAVRAAMTDASIRNIADVHFVQIKCPLLTAEAITTATARGFRVATTSTYGSMGYSRGASALGVALSHCELIVLGNAEGSASDLVIGHDVMEDAIDAGAVRRAMRAAGCDGDGAGRVVGVYAKAEASPTGRIRGRRHTMIDDSDINHTRHARAVVGGVIASVIGDPMVYVSGGAEHQGPSGGGPVAVIARRA